MGRNVNFDRARDELFGHIHRCNVLSAVDQDQATWMTETVEYLAERYPDLTQAELDELSAIGTRFCKPVIPHGKAHTALTADVVVDEAEPGEEAELGEEAESDEEAGSLAGAV